MRLCLFLCCLFALITLVSSGREYKRHSLKLRCFQCNMPYHCETGVCYGDACVKTSASNSYVSKGCENISRSVGMENYEPQKSYCKTEDVLGIDTTICYCRDGDFCNGHQSVHPLFLLGTVVLLRIL